MADSIDPVITAHVAALAGAARLASRRLGLLTRADKDEALLAMADALDSASAEIIAANDEDVARGRAEGLAEGLLDRLRLDGPRVRAVAQALRDIAALPDPVGEIVRGSTLANGLQIRQLRVPMGVVAMIYEARPNVTVDAAGLALKSGNAVVLRGGSAASASNRVLVTVLRTALEAQGLPPDAVTLLDEGGRDAVRALMTARGLVDVLIPRGGADLIQTVVRESTVPVIETGVGNCHVYVDAAADLYKALAIVVNSKTHRVGVCNAAESLLVHRSVAPEFLPKVLAQLGWAGVTVHGDAEIECSPARPARHTAWQRTRTSPGNTSHWTSAHGSSTRSTRPWRTSSSTARATPRPSSPRTARRRVAGRLRWMRRPSWSTRRRGSPTVASSGSGPRSASPRRSSMPGDRWAWQS